MNNEAKICLQWYEKSYKQEGFGSQRLYPNEELLRFLGREFFSKTKKQERKNIKVLELGCGSCSNLWMVAKEGFKTYGIDISKRAIELGQLMLDHWKVRANLTVGDITELPYKNDFFDVVFDVVSIYCLPQKQFNICLDEVRRVLKPKGKFFSYSPSTNSDAFKNYKPSKKIDEFTLNGIKRKDSPYFGNDFPFRFINPEDYKRILEEKGFIIKYLERVSRTYHQMKENFEFVTVVGEKL